MVHVQAHTHYPPWGPLVCGTHLGTRMRGTRCSTQACELLSTHPVHMGAHPRLVPTGAHTAGQTEAQRHRDSLLNLKLGKEEARI